MAAETQYTANTGIAVISTANSNLDGTGTLVNVITGASNGTLIKTVRIKARVNTTQGMVRLFLYDGTNTKLLEEVEIPAVTKSASDPAFEKVIPLYFTLKSGWILKASTEKAETFNVIAEGLDWAYYTTSVRADTTDNVIYNAASTISTANSNLDGTGTMGTPLVASNKGSNIQCITVKARVNTTPGMIRLFLYDGSSAKLFTEIPVPSVTKSATAKAFEYKLCFPDGFALKATWQLRVSTENAETFSVIPEALEWTYPA